MKSLRYIVISTVLGASVAFSDGAVSNSSSNSEKNSSSEQDLSRVSARLTIEGAKFRTFNLYFAPTKLATQITAAQAKLAEEIRAIIENDLQIVGGFNFISESLKSGVEGRELQTLLRQKGAEGMTIPTLNFAGGNSISASLWHQNLISGKLSIKNFTANEKGKRRLAHLMAQSIYEEFIGAEDIFVRQIAAIKRFPDSSKLVLMDFDGQNETVISSDPFCKATPHFSPDGQHLLYTVITEQGQRIAELSLKSKRMRYLTEMKGLNLDPIVSKDNKSMIATLGSPATIYLLTREGKRVRKLTDSLGFNLSPNITSDGKEMVFVSDRSGSPQIYVQSLDKGTKPASAKRLTFQGRYNQTPHLSPDDSLIAFTGRDENKIFDIFILQRSTGQISRITQDQGRNEDPVFTPSGRFVVFMSTRDGKQIPDLYIASINGAHQHRLTNAESQKNLRGYYSPAMRPIK